MADKVKEVENQIIANSNDETSAKKLVGRLQDLYKQLAIEPVEVEVTTKSVTDEIDFGATKIQRCSKGFLFTAKGGLQTLASWRMQSVCDMIENLFKLARTVPETEEERDYNERYKSSVLYVLQAPIFASVGRSTNPISLFEIAAQCIKSFNKVTNEVIENMHPSEETEKDVKENIAEYNALKAILNLADEAENLPNYDE